MKRFPVGWIVSPLLVALLFAGLRPRAGGVPGMLVLRYGLPPAGGATGRTVTVEGIEFVELREGFFRMGSHFLCRPGELLGAIGALLHRPWGDPGLHAAGECPPCWVEMRHRFWIARREVTCEQFLRFQPRYRPRHYGGGPIRFGDEFPREDLRLPAWALGPDEAAEFCEWLARGSGLPIRVPFEDEWEYACRAGSAGEYCFGDSPERLAEFAWFDRHVFEWKVPEEGGGRLANAWGLFDLHGNVAEYCLARSDGRAIQRGGSIQCPPEECRASRRNPWLAVEPFFGLRPVFTLEDGSASVPGVTPGEGPSR